MSTRRGLKGSALWFVSQLVPHVTSGVMFLSQIFALFAPLTLMVVALRGTRRQFIIAALSNAVLVAVVLGPLSACFFVSLICVPSWVIPRLILVRGWPVERGVLAALGCIALLGAVLVGTYWKFTGQSPLAAFELALGEQFAEVAKNSPKSFQDIQMSPEQLKLKFVSMLPLIVAAFSLILCWVNLLVLTRIQAPYIRSHLRFDFNIFKMWKSPEWLIWVTIGVGVILLTSHSPQVTIMFGSLLVFLVLIYALQGLSIITFMFDYWGITGLPRSIGFLLLVWILWAMVVGLGFFDLWFDFRAKLGQSKGSQTD